MKKFLKPILLVLILTSIFSFRSDENTTNTGPNDQVWICNSEGAYAYHYNKNCRGFSNCKHDIIQVSLAEAIKKGKKKLCGWED